MQQGCGILVGLLLLVMLLSTDIQPSASTAEQGAKLTRSSISSTISSNPAMLPSSCRASSHSCLVYTGLRQQVQFHEALLLSCTGDRLAAEQEASCLNALTFDAFEPVPL